MVLKYTYLKKLVVVVLLTYQLCIAVGTSSIPALAERQLDVSIIDQHNTLVLSTVTSCKDNRERE